MISYVVGAPGSFSVRFYLNEEGSALGDRMRIVQYDELVRLRHLPLGTWIFAEIDRLSGPERDLVCIVCERLRAAKADVCVMNDPARVRLRHDLLCAAHNAGINHFQAWPATSVQLRARAGAVNRDPDAVPATTLRYPVFVRFANQHSGNLTPLLDSPADLERAVASLAAGGIRLRELLVVEFCDTKDEHGVYRKYSAYKVGDRIIPRYLECSRDWMVKWDQRIFDRERAEEETRYLETNPHEAWIRAIFRLARIDYGRIDYGVLAGEPQVWEINMNPTIGRGPGPKLPQRADIVAYKAILAPAFNAFYNNFQNAWEIVDRATHTEGAVELQTPRALVRAIDRAERQRRTAERVGALVHVVARQRWVRPMTRAVKRALAPVALRFAR
ncbi:MAG TPA: hypothetical protein VIP11_19560 [Gemmatimonadaceae bacterium]